MISYLKRFFRNLGLTLMFIISGASIIFIFFYLASYAYNYMEDMYGRGTGVIMISGIALIVCVAIFSIADDGVRPGKSALR